MAETLVELHTWLKIHLHAGACSKLRCKFILVGVLGKDKFQYEFELEPVPAFFHFCLPKRANRWGLVLKAHLGVFNPHNIFYSMLVLVNVI